MANRVCEILGIEKPVLQGPMVWMTDARLAAAVSNAGGLGALGPNCGASTLTTDPIETAERYRAEIIKTRELTDKPIAGNVLRPPEGGMEPFTRPCLEVMFEEKVPCAVYIGPPDAEMFGEMHEHGMKVIYRGLNPSAENARAAEEAGADVQIATGFDEGGTLPNMVIGTFSVVPMIVDALEHTPVLAAGGVVDRRGFNAALALGAEGVSCGTAFLMCRESRMAQNVKERLLGCTARDLLLFRTMPAFYRSLPGELADKCMEMSLSGASNEEIGALMNGTTNLRVGMFEGDMDKGIVSVGNGITFIKEIKTAQQVIDELTADFVG